MIFIPAKTCHFPIENATLKNQNNKVNTTYWDAETEMVPL